MTFMYFKDILINLVKSPCGLDRVYNEHVKNKLDIIVFSSVTNHRR